MTRAFFLFGAAAAVAFTSLRLASARRVPRGNRASGGRCSNRRRRLRWPATTAADFA
ncbi:MAG: hypothetical protein ABSH03_00775 [Candidatus Lustribacter sp.]|jgi:hypothetical protein